MDWRIEFYEARSHLDAAARMLGVYDEYAEKRVLVGVIREGARAAGKLVRSFLIREGVKGNLDTFVLQVGPKYLDAGMIEDLVSILNIERDEKAAEVELAKGDNILFFVEGRWKVLKVSRVRELISSINDVVSNFPADIKR